ncbi:MAG: prephenate dehydratase [Candidatus Omnitrophica bacterium]|nr:prephenate dehydratase [Candidatus Omnitrophota bacterium]MDD5738016.1 prephenate dehydratase [Candidatus Omnitrophota bacterium]
MELEKLRRKIDLLDRKIIQLLNSRAQLSNRIGRLKAKANKSAYSPDRERIVYEKIAAQNEGPLSRESLQAIYREIMSGCLALEKPLRISYMGPPATFSNIAALKKFGTSVKYIPVSSITEVFAEVEHDRADYGVVPIENSIEGAINYTLDMFMESDLKICSEISIEISHNLLAKCRMGQIRRVYSNPSVFGQCRMWLESNLPRVEMLARASTTAAAEMAVREKNAAAIGSSLAAECYGLNILARSIEDSPHNMTRFLVIGKHENKPTGRDKTSIMFAVKDRVGALHDMLVPFKRNKISLTKIESRPSKKKAWDYCFFVDMEGHREDAKIKKALKQLEGVCTDLKILGSYPLV